MLDLDRLEQAVRNDEPVDTPKSLFLRLVAELRAAREVVALARFHADGHEYPLPGLDQHRAAYDQLTKEPTQ